ncbi:MAG: hypothetical protein AAFU61_09755, partial [Pseudomonadota bacterium]
MITITVNSRAAGTSEPDDDVTTFADALAQAEAALTDVRIVFAENVTTVRGVDHDFAPSSVTNGALIIDGDRDGDGVADVTFRAGDGMSMLRIGPNADVTVRGVIFTGLDPEAPPPNGKAGNGADGDTDVPWFQHVTGLLSNSIKGKPGQHGDGTWFTNAPSIPDPAVHSAPIVNQGVLSLEQVTFVDNHARAQDGREAGDGGDAGFSLADSKAPDGNRGSDGVDGENGGAGGNGGTGGNAAAGVVHIATSGRTLSLTDVVFQSGSAVAGDGGAGGSGGNGGKGGNGGTGGDGVIFATAPGGGDGGDGGDGGLGGVGGVGGSASAGIVNAGVIEVLTGLG